VVIAGPQTVTFRSGLEFSTTEVALSQRLFPFVQRARRFRLEVVNSRLVIFQ
jgi:hypothetical protein